MRRTCNDDHRAATIIGAAEYGLTRDTEKLVKQAAHLESSEKRNTDLQRQVAELQARLDAGNGASEPADDAEAQAGQNNSALEQENTALKAQLAAALAKGSNGTAATEEEWISRPRGTAGTHFSIKTAMKLDRSAADEEAYKCLLRNVRDLALNARINWELPWKQIPVDQKASLFEVARTRHPYLAKFENDWATEELVKQFIKNRRNRAYKNNWIPVPAQYQYLKANAAKRDPHAPRGKQRKLAKVGAAAKAASKKKAVTAKSRNVAPAKAKRTARKRRATDSDEDEDMEEPVASGNGASADEEEDNDE
ncbi:hypothetical protein B0H13DRAFT_2273676 [Mycena leptocephala]|nr:hypothetical protein B0H13DRAFT_2273676 [Mycena leptocephala]